MTTTTIPARLLTSGNQVVMGEDDVREVARARLSRDDARTWVWFRGFNQVVIFESDQPVMVTAEDHEF
jgi:hypothetical protein